MKLTDETLREISMGIEQVAHLITCPICSERLRDYQRALTERNTTAREE